MENKYAMVITTCANDKDAKIIVNALLEKRIAACVQLSHVDSFYLWKGSVANDPESIMFIKCKENNFEEIKQCILDLHTYETPEIIKLPIVGGSDSYLNWIDEVSK